LNKIRKIYTQFPGGRHKVLTLSYDDGKIPDRELVALFNEYGLKGSFNVNSGMEDTPFTEAYNERIPMSEYKKLYEGHEVACHSVTHPTIARCPSEQIVRQIIEDRAVLEDVMGYPVRGFAYPNGSFSEPVVDTLKSCGIVYARTVASTHSFNIPENFLLWNPTCHHADPAFEDLYESFIKQDKKQYLLMLYVWGHSYEFVRDNNFEIIEKFSKKIGNKSDIWYATNIEIVDYLERAKRIQVSVNGDFAYNPSFESVWIEVDGRSIELKGGVTTQL
jgi:peptidoglycan/xylan/chitin deacetylase (PgdA/CDA1 family)